MQQKLFKELIKLITTTPGVVGVASMDIAKSNKALPEDKYNEGISIEEKSNKVSASIALIVYDEVPMKVIADQLFESMRNLLVEQNKKIGKLNIYVRGIK